MPFVWVPEIQQRLILALAGACLALRHVNRKLGNASIMHEGALIDLTYYGRLNENDFHTIFPQHTLPNLDQINAISEVVNLNNDQHQKQYQQTTGLIQRFSANQNQD